MRVVELRLDGARALDLHPALTVVADLDEADRAVLRRSFAAVGVGVAPPTGGLVEVHGVVLDLVQDDLELVGAGEQPTIAVVTPAHLPDAAPETVARRRAGEREVLEIAARRRGQVDVGAEPASTGRMSAGSGTAHEALVARSAELRRQLAAHERTHPEPVRVALDAARDAARSSHPEAAAAAQELLADALAGVGLDVRDLAIEPDELVRIAEDWVSEWHAEARWAVGAGVELQGIEARLAAAPQRTAPVGPGEVAPVADVVEAIERLDEGWQAGCPVSVLATSAEELDGWLLEHLAPHRRTGVAGSAPMVVDGLVEHLDDVALTATLGRLADAAGAVQVVIPTDDPRAAEWARLAGQPRAAVVAPRPTALHPDPRRDPTCP